MKILSFELFLLFLYIDVLCDAIDYGCDSSYGCGCGHTNVNIKRRKRLISSNEAAPNIWSMSVLLTHTHITDDEIWISVCGGTILTDSYILTSASCVADLLLNESSHSLKISVPALNRSEPKQSQHDADRVILHPGFTLFEIGGHHDIALVHLSEPLNLESNPLITRACLPSRANNVEQLVQYPSIGSSLIAIGWGRTMTTLDQSDTLQQLSVTVNNYNQTICAELISDPSKQFSVEASNGDLGVCLGEFDGPLFQWIDNHWVQVGIASFIEGTCETSLCQISIRLAYYLDWIYSHVPEINKTKTKASILMNTTSSISNASSNRLHHVTEFVITYLTLLMVVAWLSSLLPNLISTSW